MQEWRFTSLLFVLSYGSALFFLLGLLHPEHVSENWDMRGYFEEKRTWFFGVFLCLGLLDAVDTAYKVANDFAALQTDYLPAYVAFLVVWVVGAGASMRIRNSWFVGALGVLLLFLTLYFAQQMLIMGPGLQALA